jgi:HK97 family phage portal protein
MADYLLDGNTFIELVSVGNGQAPGRLWLQRPDMVQIIVGNSRLPQAYVYTPGGVETGNSKTYPVDPLTGKCDLLHIYSYAPLSENMDGRGLSPVRSAWMSVLTHNDSVKWNHALIKNGARPSGVLQSDETLSQDQVEYLMQQIKGMFAGGANAGKVPVLGGGLTWQELSLNPVELGYLQGKDSVARDIAIAMGMPPMLLNLPGDNTFSNYAQAKQSFYEDTVIPHAKHLLEELNRWLVPRFGKNMCLKIDEDAIPALAPQRALQWDAIMASTIHTINEKRAILGFEPIENGDEVLVPSNMLPLTAAIVVDELPTTGQATQDPSNNPGDDEEEDLPQNGSGND